MKQSGRYELRPAYNGRATDGHGADAGRFAPAVAAGTSVSGRAGYCIVCLAIPYRPFLQGDWRGVAARIPRDARNASGPT